MSEEKPWLIAPLFDFNVSDDVKAALDKGGFVLSDKKRIAKYDHSKFTGFEEYVDPGMPQHRQQLKTVSYAIHVDEGADAATPQTILFFLKLIRDTNTKLVCVFSGNGANKLSDIVLRDPRQAKPNFESEHPWEALTYTMADLEVAKTMCGFYFDKIIPKLQSDDIYFPLFNGINFSRVAFTSSMSDPRLCLPMLSIAIESLYSYDSTEVAHKIAENLAWFLKPSNCDERKKYYDNFKRFYDARSRIVHGDDPHRLLKDGKAEEIYYFVLDVIRETLLKALGREEVLEIFKDKDSKKDHFQKLTLGLSR